MRFRLNCDSRLGLNTERVSRGPQTNAAGARSRTIDSRTGSSFLNERIFHAKPASVLAECSLMMMSAAAGARYFAGALAPCAFWRQARRRAARQASVGRSVMAGVGIGRRRLLLRGVAGAKRQESAAGDE